MIEKITYYKRPDGKYCGKIKTYGLEAVATSKEALEKKLEVALRNYAAEIRRTLRLKEMFELEETKQ